MAELHETLMGRKLIEGTLPDIARQLTRIADSMEDKNGSLRDSLINLVKQESNDQELGKLIRSIWQK